MGQTNEFTASLLIVRQSARVIMTHIRADCLKDSAFCLAKESGFWLYLSGTGISDRDW